MTSRALLVAVAALGVADADELLPGYRSARLGEFQERTLAEHPDLLDTVEGKDTSVVHPVEKIRVRVAFRGKVRPLAGFRERMIEAWCRQNFPPMAGGGFRREILVADGGREQWVLLQEGLWGYFEEEVRAGQTVQLDLAFIGAAGGDWLFLANGFLASPPGPDPAGLPPAPELARRCDGGDGEACVSLAWRFSTGDGVAKDLAASVRLDSRACDLGVARGCLDAGNAFERGAGATRDPTRAAALYARACEAKDARGCAWLGDVYEWGRGVPQDESKAVAAWERACAMGQGDSCIHLGVHLMDGRGAPRDQNRGLDLFKAACDRGDQMGCAHAGETYLFSGPETRQFGLDLLRRACERGPRACERLGRLQRSGEGLDKDPAAALRSFDRACGAGSASACRAIGDMHQGGEGVAKDASLARSAYGKACQLGCEECCAKAR